MITKTVNSPNWLRPIAGWVIIMSILALWSYLYKEVPLWAGMELGNAGKSAEYCELNRITLLIRQPANTWSNLVYVLLGLLIIEMGLADRRGPGRGFIRSHPSSSFWIAGWLIVLGLGSFFYHGSLTYPGQLCDMWGTYGFTNSLALMSLFAWKYRDSYNIRKRRYLLFALNTLLAIGMGATTKWGTGSIFLPLVILIMIGAGVGCAFFPPGKKYYHSYALLAIGSMMVAVVLRQLDASKTLCDPMSLVQGHAAWHILSGLGGFYFYLFLRSETVSGNA